MRLIFVGLSFFALLGLLIGTFFTVNSPAVGGPILISSALYLGLFSIAYVIDDKGRRN